MRPNGIATPLQDAVSALGYDPQHSVLVWGANTHGQCSPDDDEIRNSSLASTTIPVVMRSMSGLGVVGVSCGLHFSVAWTDQGTVYVSLDGVPWTIWCRVILRSTLLVVDIPGVEIVKVNLVMEQS